MQTCSGRRRRACTTGRQRVIGSASRASSSACLMLSEASESALPAGATPRHWWCRGSSQVRLAVQAWTHRTSPLMSRPYIAYRGVMVDPTQQQQKAKPPASSDDVLPWLISQKFALGLNVSLAAHRRTMTPSAAGSGPPPDPASQSRRSSRSRRSRGSPWSARTQIHEETQSGLLAIVSPHHECKADPNYACLWLAECGFPLSAKLVPQELRQGEDMCTLCGPSCCEEAQARHVRLLGFCRQLPARGSHPCTHEFPRGCHQSVQARAGGRLLLLRVAARDAILRHTAERRVTAECEARIEAHCACSWCKARILPRWVVWHATGWRRTQSRDRSSNCDPNDACSPLHGWPQRWSSRCCRRTRQRCLPSARRPNPDTGPLRGRAWRRPPPASPAAGLSQRQGSPAATRTRAEGPTPPSHPAWQWAPRSIWMTPRRESSGARHLLPAGLQHRLRATPLSRAWHASARAQDRHWGNAWKLRLQSSVAAPASCLQCRSRCWRSGRAGWPAPGPWGVGWDRKRGMTRSRPPTPAAPRSAPCNYQHEVMCCMEISSHAYQRAPTSNGHRFEGWLLHISEPACTQPRSG